MVMKTTLFYPTYDTFNGRGWCRLLNAKHGATTAAIYTLNIAILVVLLYSWRISVNMKRYSDLQEVYYGVQIAYFAIIGTQLFMIVLSFVLLYGVNQEQIGYVVPWIIGIIAFTAMEAVSTVYSNVLRDHVNREFDALCKAEMAFFMVRTVTNMVALYAVMRFFHLLRGGVTWKGPEAIEL